MNDKSELVLFVLQSTDHKYTFTVTKFLEKDAVERKLQVGDLVDFEFDNKSGKAVVVKVTHRDLFDRSILLQPKM